jgi:hypothetical protein
MKKAKNEILRRPSAVVCKCHTTGMLSQNEVVSTTGFCRPRLSAVGDVLGIDGYPDNGRVTI